jgi:hypothetical protein
LPGWNSYNLLILRGSLLTVDRDGYCRFRANQAVKGQTAERRRRRADILICSEKDPPLRSTAFPKRLMSLTKDYIATLAPAAIVIAWIN